MPVRRSSVDAPACRSVRWWTRQLVPCGRCPLTRDGPESQPRPSRSDCGDVADDSGRQPVGRWLRAGGPGRRQIMETRQPNDLGRRNPAENGGCGSRDRRGPVREAGVSRYRGAARGAWNHDPASPIGSLHQGDIGFPTCGQCMSQSPVDIRTGKVAGSAQEGPRPAGSPAEAEVVSRACCPPRPWRPARS